jgi:hypothetical protein
MIGMIGNLEIFGTYNLYSTSEREREREREREKLSSESRIM